MYRTFVFTLAMLACGAAAAKDLDRLLDARHSAEARAAAEQRLAADPKDEQAYWTLARAGLELSHGGAAFERLAAEIEPCLAAIPQSALCHLALGEVYGEIAASGGFLKGMKYAGRVRREFETAVELDPRNFKARDDLGQFYLQAPAVVGGGEGKAEANAKGFAALRPEAAPLLYAGIALHRGRRDEAARLLLAPGAFAAPDLADGYRDALNALGSAELEAGRAAQALAAYQAARTRFPNDAEAWYGDGRSRLELGQVEPAIDSLRRAAELDPALGAQYRLGIAFEHKGETGAAIDSYRAYLALPAARRSAAAAEDASRRLEALQRSG